MVNAVPISVNAVPISVDAVLIPAVLISTIDSSKILDERKGSISASVKHSVLFQISLSNAFVRFRSLNCELIYVSSSS